MLTWHSGGWVRWPQADRAGRSGLTPRRGAGSVVSGGGGGDAAASGGAEAQPRLQSHNKASATGVSLSNNGMLLVAAAGAPGTRERRPSAETAARPDAEQPPTDTKGIWLEEAATTTHSFHVG